MNTNKNVLVLGATGGIGSEVASQLKQAGWTVFALTRHTPDENKIALNYQWLLGDALNSDDVLAAAKTCSVIVHAVNPPGYKNWGTLVMPMLKNTISAAKKVGATVVLPGTVYNYGKDAFPVIAEDAMQNPCSRKGEIRKEMEQHLRDYAEQGGQSIILRAGDFFGPRAGNNWFSQGLIKPNKPVTVISNPSKKGVGHQWSYLPDVAQTIVKLIESRNKLSSFENFHMSGHWDNNGLEMLQAIQEITLRRTKHQPKIKPFPWWLLRLLSPFQQTVKEIMEVQYLWQTPIKMDNKKLISILGKEPHTPLNVAVENTLNGLGCLR